MDRKNIVVRVHIPPRVDENMRRIRISQLYDILSKNSGDNTDRSDK